MKEYKEIIFRIKFIGYANKLGDYTFDFLSASDHSDILQHFSKMKAPLWMYYKTKQAASFCDILGNLNKFGDKSRKGIEDLYKCGSSLHTVSSCLKVLCSSVGTVLIYTSTLKCVVLFYCGCGYKIIQYLVWPPKHNRNIWQGKVTPQIRFPKIRPKYR